MQKSGLTVFMVVPVNTLHITLRLQQREKFVGQTYFSVIRGLKQTAGPTVVGVRW